MDYEKAIHAIIDPLVEEPSSLFIKINEEEDQKNLAIVIAAEKGDIARLIGRHGSIANAIREMVSVGGKCHGQHVHIKFESFNENEEKEGE